MGGGINLGGSVGLPGLSGALDINASLQQDNPTSKIKDVRFGLTGGFSPGSLGPGGAEIHLDYSYATPFLWQGNIKDLPDAIRKQLDLTKNQIDNLIRYINSIENYLRQEHYGYSNALIPGNMTPSTKNYSQTPPTRSVQHNPIGHSLPHSTLSSSVERSSSQKKKQQVKPYVAGQHDGQSHGQPRSQHRDYSYP